MAKKKCPYCPAIIKDKFYETHVRDSHPGAKE